jgi:hypothetical protein
MAVALVRVMTTMMVTMGTVSIIMMTFPKKIPVSVLIPPLMKFQNM